MIASLSLPITSVYITLLEPKAAILSRNCSDRVSCQLGTPEFSDGGPWSRLLLANLPVASHEIKSYF